MKYQDLLNSENIVSVILKSLETRIEELVLKIETVMIEKLHLEPLTESQKDNLKLELVFDLVKSIEKYTLSTDKLININSEYSAKGNLTIDAVIERDSNLYNLVTEVIYAGGYNIQKLHYRYITKTNLPQTRNTELTTIINNEIKRISKVEKIQNDINILKNKIQTKLLKIEKNSKLTDEQIFDIVKLENRLLTTKWEDIDEDSYTKQHNTKEEFLKKQQDYINEVISDWKYFNIESPSETNNAYQKLIDKLNIKLDNLN